MSGGFPQRETHLPPPAPGPGGHFRGVKKFLFFFETPQFAADLAPQCHGPDVGPHVCGVIFVAARRLRELQRAKWMTWTC
jgi:hypothetical protein